MTASHIKSWIRSISVASVFFWLLLSLHISAQPPKPGDRVRAKQILEWMKAGEYGKVIDQLDSSAAAKLDTAKLSSVWNNMLRNAGPFREVQSTTDEQQPGYTMVIQRCLFGEKSIDFKLVFGGNGKVKGLFFLPADSKERYKLPAYYDSTKVSERSVIIENGPYRLPGTLTYPSKGKFFAAVVLVHGSGPNDRDESVGGTKIFKDLALGLATKGVAVLRYEKRTRIYRDKFTSRSDYTVEEETIQDAVAAAEWLQRDSLINPDRVYVLGHSLGAHLLPRIASGMRKKSAGYIALCPNARRLEELFVDQAKYIVALDGKQEKYQQLLDSLEREAGIIKGLHADSKDTLAHLSLPASYWIDLNRYDAFTAFREMKGPLYIMQGGRDYQVTTDDYKLWEEKLNGRKPTAMKLYPQLNHFFITGEGKSKPAEYNKSANFSETVLNDIYNWISKDVY
ncbi:MAG TPA: alpha/beta fold hydrolase [Bacteroidia bacterium]|jgi:dienelactone hydrolase|uniref:alpha/beta hydrolase n=1 Tax=Candidatus Pollutiaquabacter sp. TaxID=3416354 RepID=UPI001A61C823|nr:alpha/beta fold hydrolase [Bacteroidota bacterium]MBL7947563.1 alpha/beta fold hydrolase [Bacteroidia bacterium]HRU60419.1 alpha/beta fold hydrolase [Bacteroidia bacterium]